MKKVIKNRSDEVIPIEALECDSEHFGKPVAYRMKSHTDSYAVLSRLNNGSSYGFVPLNSSISKPRFRAEYWNKAVEEAMAYRDVYIFENQDEMLFAMLHKKF